MINLYFGDNSVPKDAAYVYDAEPLYAIIDFLYDDYAREVVKEVEGGTVQTADTFLDRFGRGFYASGLSTSSKIILLAHQEDYVINADGIGRNALTFFMENSDAGSLHFSFFPDMRVPNKYPININDILCTDIVELLNITDRVI